MNIMALVAKDMATSDTGRAFGMQKVSQDEGLLPAVGAIAENVLRASHLIPVVGRFTGLVSLGLFAYRMSYKTQMDDEDRGELIRDTMAILGANLYLAALDAGATYFRSQEVWIHLQPGVNVQRRIT